MRSNSGQSLRTKIEAGLLSSSIRNNLFAATPFGETSSDTLPEPEDRVWTQHDDSRVGLATTASQLPSAQQQEQERARRSSRGSLTTIVFAGERELNIHHAAAYASLVPEVSYGKQVQLQLASTGLVLAQLVVVYAIGVGCAAPVCSENWQCPAQRVCAPNGFWYMGIGKACFNCQDEQVWGRLADYLPLVNSTNFSCPEHDSLCRGCYDPILRSFPAVGLDPELSQNFNAMQWTDWVAVVLTTLLIAFAVADNIQEIIFCELFRNLRSSSKKPPGEAG